MKYSEKDDVLPSLVSILIPGVQLLGLLIINLTEIFAVSEIFIYNQHLNLVNLLTILLTSSFIGYLWYYRNNYHWMRVQNEPYNSEYLYIKKLLKGSLCVSVVSLVVFIAMGVVGDTHAFSQVLGWIQLLTYTAILTASGVILYVWLTEFIKKKKSFKPEDFMPRLLRTLEEYGHLKRHDVTVNSSAYEDSNRILEISINGTLFNVTTNFDASEIKMIKQSQG